MGAGVAGVGNAGSPSLNAALHPWRHPTARKEALGAKRVQFGDMGGFPAEQALSESLSELVDSSVDALEKAYSIGDVIGEGRFSKVYSGIGTEASKTGAGVLVALKEIDQCTLEEDEEAIEMLEAEVLALRRCSGTDHVVTLHEVIASKSEECIYLAMERVPGRELFELVEERGALPSVLVRTLVRQLLSALEALAGLGVVHRDVKPENLMVTEDAGSDGARLTLIDFGYAALLGDSGSGGADGDALLSGVAGSPEYAAPEVLSWLEVEADETGTVEGERYDAGCDVWSVGVTTHVLLSAELPFELPEEADEASLVAAARNIQLTFAKRVWAEEGMDAAKDFVRQCMTAERLKRPTASALLSHPWLDGISSKATAPAAAVSPPAMPSPAVPPKGDTNATFVESEPPRLAA